MSFTESEIRVERFSGQGAGGQNRNKSQKCIRIHHLPSGVIVVGQRERSLEANMRAAMEQLEAVLAERNVVHAERIETVMPEAIKRHRVNSKRHEAQKRANRRINW